MSRAGVALTLRVEHHRVYLSVTTDHPVEFIGLLYE